MKRHMGKFVLETGIGDQNKWCARTDNTVG